MKKAIYPGSFDPPTLGHMDIINRASKIFDMLEVGIFVNPSKNFTFDLEQRVNFLKKMTHTLENVEIIVFDGLLSEYVLRNEINAIVRGIRDFNDFHNELSMSLINRKLNKDVETVFLPGSIENLCISSSAVKEISKFDGNIKDFLPECIYEEVKSKLISKN